MKSNVLVSMSNKLVIQINIHYWIGVIPTVKHKYQCYLATKMLCNQLVSNYNPFPSIIKITSVIIQKNLLHPLALADYIIH